MRRAAGVDARPIYVAALGLDGFSRMRGALGYELTAELVRALGAQLQALSAEVDVARVAPETLGVAFQAKDLNEAVLRAETARRTVQGVHRLREHLIDVRVTGGLGAGGPPAALVREADLALDAARTAGKRAAVFDAAAHASAAQSLSLMPELRDAIARGGLHLEHQPKFDLRRQAFAGVECLVRWRHPRLGWLAPDLFVGMSEDTGDIHALTEWVLDRAISEQASLALAGHHLSFAVNLSGRMIGEFRGVDALLEQAAAAQGPLTFEITETAVISDPEAALQNIERITAAGHGVSIDDYGAGLSSLSYLKRIHANELKLDRSLLVDLTRSSRDALLIRSTIDLAHALGMKVVAEGVEEDAALALLAGMGCDLVQGWLISKSMPFERLREFLDQDAAAPQHRTAKA